MKSLKVKLGDKAEGISFWTTTSSESLVLVPEFWQVAQSERWKTSLEMIRRARSRHCDNLASSADSLQRVTCSHRVPSHFWYR